MKFVTLKVEGTHEVILGDPPSFFYGGTSRKRYEKEPQLFIHSGSFDHPDLHLLNDYKFVVFVL